VAASSSLHRLLAPATDDEERRRAYARVAVLQAALEARGRGGALRREGVYRARLLERWTSKR
jgi:hypothetical protein